MKVQDITTDELKILIREVVRETLEELLPDPDEGAKIEENFKRQLLEIRKRREKKTQRVSASEGSLQLIL